MGWDAYATLGGRHAVARADWTKAEGGDTPAWAIASAREFLATCAAHDLGVRWSW